MAWPQPRRRHMNGGMPPAAILFDLDDTIIAAGERAPLLLEVADELRAALAPHAPAFAAIRR